MMNIRITEINVSAEDWLPDFIWHNKLWAWRGSIEMTQHEKYKDRKE